MLQGKPCFFPLCLFSSLPGYKNISICLRFIRRANLSKTSCYFKHLMLKNLVLSFGCGGVTLHAGSGPSQLNKAKAGSGLILSSFCDTHSPVKNDELVAVQRLCSVKIYSEKLLLQQVSLIVIA